MNNTEKLDAIKRTLRRIETRLGIIQRTNVIMFERITGGAFPHSWVIHDDEKAILSDLPENEPVTLDQLSIQLNEYIEANEEHLKSLTERITRIEAQPVTGKDKTLSPC
jgi:hypothetical protein